MRAHIIRKKTLRYIEQTCHGKVQFHRLINHYNTINVAKNNKNLAYIIIHTRPKLIQT